MSDKPDHQRPELPAFWDKRFGEGTTLGGRRRAGGIAQLRRCRHGRPTGDTDPGLRPRPEAAWLAQRGWPVTALDFSASAIATARGILGDWPGELVEGDFFTYSPPTPFALVYERAFLCAPPRRLWQDYGRRMHELLAPEGRPRRFFFFGEDPKGRPSGFHRNISTTC